MSADRTGWFAAAGVETAAAVVKAGAPDRGDNYMRGDEQSVQLSRIVERDAFVEPAIRIPAKC